jgi:phosphopantothenoylcysteine decarboxylase / phosphopantothenate---cysteine ligase
MASPLAGRRVLLGVTGGIAAYKSAYLARLLRERGAEVQVVMTPAATRFVGPDTFAALTGRPVHSEVFDHTEAVLHVRLARQAEVAVIAPATANVLAKLAVGIADDLLTSTLLEFRGPVVAAPAMHTGMYEHPATARNLETLRAHGVRLVGPDAGPLAAGDEGMGRMAEPEAIAAAVEEALATPAPHPAGGGTDELRGRVVLVTAGPTHEPIDAVRFLGNRSSGKMGFAVAEAARDRGATVLLVAGPTHLPDPPGVEVVRVETAAQMRAAVAARFDEADAVVKAAAVADFRPAEPVTGKLKKDAGPPELRLEPTEDILAELGERKGNRVLVGFAAETADLEEEGLRKLRAKGLDIVVVNQVGRPGTGFEADTNRAAILTAGGEVEPVRRWTKAELASAICDRLAKLLAERGS